MGTPEACGRAKAEVEDWIRRESGEGGLLAAAGTDPAEDATSPSSVSSQRSLLSVDAFGSAQPRCPLLFLSLSFRMREEGTWSRSEETSGPSLITFWLPPKAVALVLGPEGQTTAKLEREQHCLISIKDEGPDGLAPVELTAKDNRKALEAKDAILAYLAHFMPRDWPDRVRIRTIGHPHGLLPLPFPVPCRHWPVPGRSEAGPESAEQPEQRRRGPARGGLLQPLHQRRAAAHQGSPPPLPPSPPAPIAIREAGGRPVGGEFRSVGSMVGQGPPPPPPSGLPSLLSVPFGIPPDFPFDPTAAFPCFPPPPPSLLGTPTPPQPNIPAGLT